MGTRAEQLMSPAPQGPKPHGSQLGASRGDLLLGLSALFQQPWLHFQQPSPSFWVARVEDGPCGGGQVRRRAMGTARLEGDGGAAPRCLALLPSPPSCHQAEAAREQTSRYRREIGRLPASGAGVTKFGSQQATLAEVVARRCKPEAEAEALVAQACAPL